MWTKRLTLFLAQYYDQSLDTMVTTSESFNTRLVTDMQLFEDESMPLYMNTHSQHNSSSNQWAPSLIQDHPQNQFAVANIPSYIPNNTQYLASPSPHQILGSSPDIFDNRRQQTYAGTPSSAHQYPQTETPSPFMELDEVEEWISPSAPTSNYALSHHSPTSQGSPISRASPSIAERGQHSHVVHSELEVPKIKGRQRNLTAKEKKEARDVRDAKACWACHISKTKVRATLSI